MQACRCWMSVDGPGESRLPDLSLLLRFLAASI